MASSLLSQLLARRVPQIIGLYVAATWMTIEIGEWLTERLGLPANLTLWIFAAMAALLPSVALIAWFHGAPGKDRWTGLEQVFAPLNLVAAAGLVWVLVERAETPLAQAVASTDQGATTSTETRSVVDESGAAQSYEVAVEGHHRRIFGFFWQAAEDMSWARYAVPWLLSVDLSRDPVITINTPYELDLRDAFVDAGFPDGTGEPLALDLKLAREGAAQLIVVGRHALQEGRHQLQARVVDVESGAVEHVIETADEDLLTAVEALSDELAAAIAGDRVRGDSGHPDLALTESVTGDEGALELLIEGLNAWFFANDFQSALARLDDAVERDPAFAVAHFWRSLLYRQAGDLEASVAAIDAALTYDYKLDSQTQFKLKANRYAMGGEIERAVRVLEVWAEVHPDSFEVYDLLGRNYTITGQLDEARAALHRLYELNPKAREVVRRIADIDRMRGEPEAAIELLETYLATHPDDGDARLRLADSLLQGGRFDDARAQYDRAAFVADKDFEATLGIARTLAREGRFEAAEARFGDLNARDLTPGDQVQLGMAELQLRTLLGQIDAAGVAYQKLAEVGPSVLPPALMVFVLGGTRAMLDASVGEFALAADALDEMASNLAPPMNGLVDLSRLSLFAQAEDAAALEETLKSVRAFRTTFKMNALDPLLTAAAGELALLQGKPDEAVTLRREALKTLRQSLFGLEQSMVDQFTVKLGAALRAAGQLDEAAALLGEHLQRAPSDALGRMELAHTLLAQGAVDKALVEVERVLAQWSQGDPDYHELRDARELHEQLNNAIAQAENG